MLRVEDLGQLVTASEAARAIGVTTSAVCAWDSRGYLNAIDGRGKRKLYLLRDVLVVSQQTQRRALGKHRTA